MTESRRGIRRWAAILATLAAVLAVMAFGADPAAAVPTSYEGRWTGTATIETCTSIPFVFEGCTTGDPTTRSFTLVGHCDGTAPCELVTKDEALAGEWGWSTGDTGDCLTAGTDPDYQVSYAPLPMSFEASLAGTAETPELEVEATWPNPVQPPGGVSVLKVAFTATRSSTTVPAPSGGCDGPPVCTSPFPGPFSDVPSTHPFCTDIAWMASSGVSTGYPDGTFRPTLGVSRQAMASFLHRFAGEPASTLPEPFFADVTLSHPFYDAIQWMAESGLSTGTPNPPGKPLYKPSDLVSRQAMAAFLHRFAGTPAVTLTEPFFADVSGGPFFAAIQWMAESGLSTGTPDPPGKPLYKPTSSVSRQAMAAFLHRYDDLEP